MSKSYDIEPILDQMAADLRARFAGRDLNALQVIGIYTGGVWLARSLHQRLDLTTPLGALDISFYRDDFSQAGMHPEVKPSHLPFEVEGADVLLVDDVLFTGRTIRAALNEIFDYGRPATVTLAVLVERPGRELPVQADVVGVHIDLDCHEHIKLSGPEPLALKVVETL